MSKATQSQLELLHGVLAKTFIDRILSGEATAAELNAARQFLKDNNIDAVPKEANGLDKLAGLLPFQEEETDRLQ